jgi:hypothetical protein
MGKSLVLTTEAQFIRRSLGIEEVVFKKFTNSAFANKFILKFLLRLAVSFNRFKLRQQHI